MVDFSLGYQQQRCGLKTLFDMKRWMCFADLELGEIFLHLSDRFSVLSDCGVKSPKVTQSRRGRQAFEIE